MCCVIKKAKPRDNTKKAEEPNAYFRTLKIGKKMSHLAIKFNRTKGMPSGTTGCNKTKPISHRTHGLHGCPLV